LFYVGDNEKKIPADYFDWEQRASTKIVLNVKDLGLEGKVKVRDVWRQKNLGEFENSFEAEVAWHGVNLLRVSK
jgi:alpha-galactosidase